MLIATLLSGLFCGFLANLYSFLSPDYPPHKGVMVIEGWIHDFALDEAVSLYRSGDYTEIICTGTPIETGNFLLPFDSYPEMTALRLKKLGIPESEIITAIGDDVKKDRTYAAAVALREAFMTYPIHGTDIHLVTVGPHGRRSRMLFQKALGKDYRVGVTCLEPRNYDEQSWITCSEGVRNVMSEYIAFTYAKLFFHP